MGIEGYLGEEHAVEEPVVPQIPAAKRIQNLFKSMAPRRKTLLGILAFVETPQSTTALEAKVDELQAHNFSVYSSGNLSALLEQAGAITRVTEEGEPYENIQNEPEIVEIDGVEYLQPVTFPKSTGLSLRTAPIIWPPIARWIAFATSWSKTPSTCPFTSASLPCARTARR